MKYTISAKIARSSENISIVVQDGMVLTELLSLFDNAH